MNIFVVTVEKDVFIVDEGLSPSLAKRTVMRYNEMFSAELSGVTYKDSPTTLKFIKGYCISDKDELPYTQAMKLIKEL